MTEPDYRMDLAMRTFGMLVLKKGAVAPAVGNPRAERVATAQEAFDYADAFIEVAKKQGIVFDEAS